MNLKNIDMKVTVGVFTDGKERWTSLIIDNLGIAQHAIQDIIGYKLARIHLNDHAIYGLKLGGEVNFVDHNTAKAVYKDMSSYLYKNENLVMNIEGGYLPMKQVTWKLLETKVFECSTRANLLTLLKEQNGKNDEFRIVSHE